VYYTPINTVRCVFIWAFDTSWHNPSNLHPVFTFPMRGSLSSHFTPGRVPAGTAASVAAAAAAGYIGKGYGGTPGGYDGGGPGGYPGTPCEGGAPYLHPKCCVSSSL
jgi:hypothetical protein